MTFLRINLDSPWKQIALFSRAFLAPPARLELTTFRLGDMANRLLGVCYIHIINILRIFRHRALCLAVIFAFFAVFTIAYNTVAPNRVPKTVPNRKQSTKSTLFPRSAGRFKTGLYDRNVGIVCFGWSTSAQIIMAAIHGADSTAARHKLVCISRLDFVPAAIASYRIFDD